MAAAGAATAGAAAAGVAAVAIKVATAAAAAAGTVAAAGMGAALWRRHVVCVCVCVCVVRRGRVCACVGDVCVRMRGCGVGLNRGDSPAAPPGPATRDPPRQREENRMSLARGGTQAQQSYAISSGGGGCT